LSALDVAVVDDHLLIAETLHAALYGRGISAAVVVPDQRDELLAQLVERRPRLVLLDLDLGRFGSSVGLIAPLTAAGISVLVMTGITDRLRIAEALEHGAIGYQPKADGFDALLDRTVLALESRRVLDPEGRAVLLSELVAARSRQRRVMERFERLTEREDETLRALCAGRSVRDIADDWVVSEATVRTHVRGILTKLGEPSQLAAVVAASTSGWSTSQRSERGAFRHALVGSFI
jgi:DNA-binding NarL/FixJ family response regulator